MSDRRNGLWRHYDFRRLWAAQTVSVFGSMITASALPFTAILALDASALQVGVLAASRMAPELLAGPIAGVWVDRLRRLPVMIVADIGRAVALLSVPLAWAFDALTIEQLYAVALVTGVLTLFFEVAYRSYLPSIVDAEELVEGNSKLTASSAVAEFSGFSVSGWLVQIFSGPIAILVDALTFIGSAAFLRSIRSEESAPEPSAETASMRREATEGLRFVRADARLRTLSVALALHSFGFGIFAATYTLFVTRTLGFETGVLGIIFGIGGISSLVGAVAAERASARLGLGTTMVLGVLTIGVTMSATPFLSGAGVLVAGVLVAQQVFGDGPFTAYDVNAVSLRQSLTPTPMQGRVNAFMRMTEVGLMLAGTLIGGVLGETAGLRPTLALGGAAVLAAGAWLAASPLRRIRSAAVVVEEVGVEATAAT